MKLLVSAVPFLLCRLLGAKRNQQRVGCFDDFSIQFYLAQLYFVQFYLTPSFGAFTRRCQTKILLPRRLEDQRLRWVLQLFSLRL